MMMMIPIFPVMQPDYGKSKQLPYFQQFQDLPKIYNPQCSPMKKAEKAIPFSKTQKTAEKRGALRSALRFISEHMPFGKIEGEDKEPRAVASCAVSKPGIELINSS